jgi:pimeloyl-ACP methyl ester carboxylesterase
MNARALFLISALLSLAFVHPGPNVQTKIVQNDKRKAIKDFGSHSQMITNGAARLDVKVRGEGETLVMLPSLGRSVRDFNQIAERLVSNKFRVVLPEPRGIGQSTGPTGKLTLHDLAEDIATIIKAISKEPVTIVGHAFGNRLARVVATDHPTLVKSIVLIAAGGLQPIRPDIRQALENCFDEQLPRAKRLAAIKLAFFADGNDPAIWEKGWYKDVAHYQSAANTATPVKDWWAAGNSRVLVLQGAEDTVAVRENSEHLAKEFGDRITVIDVPKAGHALLPEQPEFIIKAILDFLRK